MSPVTASSSKLLAAAWSVGLASSLTVVLWYESSSGWARRTAMRFRDRFVLLGKWTVLVFVVDPTNRTSMAQDLFLRLNRALGQNPHIPSRLMDVGISCKRRMLGLPGTRVRQRLYRLPPIQDTPGLICVQEQTASRSESLPSGRADPANMKKGIKRADAVQCHTTLWNLVPRKDQPRRFLF